MNNIIRTKAAMPQQIVFDSHHIWFTEAKTGHNSTDYQSI
jgi:hypothetical protein